MTVTHTLVQAGPPTEAPPSIGAHYIDSDAKSLYLSVGTASVGDWVMLATKAEVLALADRVTALEPSAHALLLEVEFTAESWWFGDYPTIVSVQGMVGDTVDADLDLSLFGKAGEAGADVTYDSGSGNVQIGYSDRYTAINTGTQRAPNWTKVRIGLSGIGSFDGVINVLNQLDPRDQVASQAFARGNGTVYVDVAV